MSDRRQRLWDKVMRRTRVHLTPPPGLETPCWEWTGPDSGKGKGGGYARMCVDGATMAVHIVMWVIKNGPIPPKKELDHLCVFRKCVNPEHLKLSTRKQNNNARIKRTKLVCVAGDQLAA